MENITEYTDAVDEFLFASALHLISSTLGKYIGIVNLPTTGGKYVKPNLWVLVIGEPNVSRKSTVITLERKIIERAWEKFFVDHEGLDEEEAEKKASLMFIEQGSAEGIADQITLAQREYDLDMFYIMSAEWGNVFADMKNRAYLGSLANLLSKLWDSDRYSWVGSKRVKNAFDRYIREGTYVTAMLGMQKASLYIDEIFLQQGLLRRFFIVNTISIPKTRHLPVIYHKREDVATYLLGEEYFVGELVDRMGAYYRACQDYGIVLAIFDKRAEEVINEFAKEIESMEDVGEWKNYTSGAWNHIVRIAMILAASRQLPKENYGIAYIDVGEDDVSRAIEFYRKLEPHAKEAIIDILTPKKKEPHVDREYLQEKVYHYIVEAEGRGITLRELCRKIRNRYEVFEALADLLTMGRVSLFKIQRGKGRPSYRVLAVKYRDRPDPIFYDAVELIHLDDLRKALHLGK